MTEKVVLNKTLVNWSGRVQSFCVGMAMFQWFTHHQSVGFVILAVGVIFGSLAFA